MSLTARVYLQLLGVWTDVTEDLAPDPLRWSRGIFDQGPLARLAAPGNFTFALDNSTQNSAGLAGYYSPGHVNARAGFRYGIGVRLWLSDGINSRYVWRGTLHAIAPEPGSVGPLRTSCMADDWMALFESTDAVDLVLRELVRPDQLLQDLIDRVEIAPALTDIDVGQDEYPFAFDDLGGDTPKCTPVAQDILQSEGGYLYVRGDAVEGETLRFENRFARALASTVATFGPDDLAPEGEDPLQVPSSVDHIANDVEVAVIPRRSDPSATSALVRLDGPVSVAPGETVTMFVDYRDPNNDAQYVGGKNMQPPAANTDYTANALEDGTGSDLTVSVAVTASYFGARCKVALTNSGTVQAYVRGPAGVAGLQLRGRGLYRYSPLASRAQNAGSIAMVGARQLPTPMVMPYQDDHRIGQDIATFIANLWGDLEKIPTRVRILTEFGGELLAHGINRDIGDRIAITEAQTAVDEATVFINGIEQELEPSGVLRTWWTLAPADTTDLFIFDNGRFDESAFGYG